MNPELHRLQPYPFERLRALFSDLVGEPSLRHIALQIGEPKHPTPELIKRAVSEGISGLANYPATAGTIELRNAIRAWIIKRHKLRSIDADSEVLPVIGSREALFAIAQVVIRRNIGQPIVICPNPFYQIYEGATILAGGHPHFVNMTETNQYAADYGSVADEVWRATQLLYVCSPANPTGRVTRLKEWAYLFEQADKYDFVIASDECYSELYFDEDAPPLGALAAAEQLGRTGFERVIVFSSLSKRSNVPGMRSGFVAGDSRLMKDFLLYRTYHGSAMSPVFQRASVAAWTDEVHVAENRRMYSDKFQAVVPLLEGPLQISMPEAGFYLWIRTPIHDTLFARGLYHRYNVSVLPGSFLGRTAQGQNPGYGYVRIALVAPLDECVQAANRIAQYAKSL